MTNVKTYAKTETVEAIQWDGTHDSATEVIQWILNNGGPATFSCGGFERCLANKHVIRIRVGEAYVDVNVGDYVVKHGELFLPEAASHFLETYKENS